MRSLLLAGLLAFVLPSVSFAVGPFENFKGTYKIDKEPRIVKDNILYCNWLNLKNIITLKIDTLNGNETAEVVSITNSAGHTQHSYITFFEYSHPEEQYPRHAELSGTENSATYTVTTHRDGYVWTMKNENSNYTLEIVYHNTYKNAYGECRYYVELKKVTE